MSDLPEYRGLEDAPLGWGEPDGHGKKPNLRLRDFVAVAVLLVFAIPIFSRHLIVQYGLHERVIVMEKMREFQLHMARQHLEQAAANEK